MSEKAEERKPYVLEVEPTEFIADAEVKILTSNEFCRIINEYFRTAFNDFIGTKFEIISNAPVVSAYFDHSKREENGTYAVAMTSGSNGTNSVIEKSRAYDRLLREGDRYHITDDGKDIIKPLLLSRYVNNKGKVNWGDVVADTTDGNGSMYQPQQMQRVTKISGIDPVKLAGIIYGKKEGNAYVDYGIEIKGDLNLQRGFVNTAVHNYVLYITRTNFEHISNTYEKLGLAGIGSTIVR